MPPRQDTIEVRGAAEHNLRRVDVRLPKHALIVFTGPSGSGKSSLAFDTIYAEGQRRYVESLSSYARQFLGQMEKPQVRPHPRPLADHLDRAEGGEQQPALDRRHDHRGLRLPARALGAHRAPALPPLRPAGRAALGRGDRRPAGRAAAGHALPPAGAPRRQPQGRVPRAAATTPCAEGFARFRIDGAGRARATSCRRSTRSASTPSTSWSTGSPCPSRARSSARASPTRSRPALRKGRAAPAAARSSAARSASTPRTLWCHHCDLGFPELSPAELLLQLAARHVPRLQRPRHQARDGPRAGRARSHARACGDGAIEPWAKVMRALVELDRLAAQQDRRGVRHRLRPALGQAARAPPRPAAARLARAGRSR